MVSSRPIPHRQSTDTIPTVDRNISAEVSAECRPTYRPIVSTDGLLTKTTCRPTLGRVSVDISAECRSPYRPIVSTDTRSTDALSTHDPKNLTKRKLVSSLQGHLLHWQLCNFWWLFVQCWLKWKLQYYSQTKNVLWSLQWNRFYAYLHGCKVSLILQCFAPWYNCPSGFNKVTT